ncbi:uncharacterized protein [Macrobrachium rosenbergii]|uniref:uncharacterized protein n=1 Tax=Macrobrachium rosenbergii TaxID=79674 RepID=UPI0034D47138
MPNNNTIVLSDYCGLGSSMADTPANVYMNLVNYFLSLNASSNPGEIECMTDLLIEFVALVENGTVSFPPSDIPRLLNATEEAITWINTLQQELMASLSTTTTTKTSVTPEVVIPPHEASKRNRLSLQIIQNVVLPQK